MMNEAYNTDCMDYMKTLSENEFDLAIVDPPYGIGVMTMSYTKGGAIRTRGNALVERRDYRKQSEWDIKPTGEYFKELFRVSKKQIIWGGNYFSDLIPPSKSFVIWDKRTDEKFTNDFSDCEYAWCSKGMGVPRVFRYLWSGMLQQNMKNKEERFHPTQKPVALYEWLLEKYAKKGDKILDTHLGSGSSRIAAYNLNFDFVGCEIDKEYFDKQQERFGKHISQMRLNL